MYTASRKSGTWRPLSLLYWPFGFYRQGRICVIYTRRKVDSKTVIIYRMAGPIRNRTGAGHNERSFCNIIGTSGPLAADKPLSERFHSPVVDDSINLTRPAMKLRKARYYYTEKAIKRTLFLISFEFYTPF